MIRLRYGSWVFSVNRGRRESGATQSESGATMGRPHPNVGGMAVLDRPLAASADYEYFIFQWNNGHAGMFCLIGQVPEVGLVVKRAGVRPNVIGYE